MRGGKSRCPGISVPTVKAGRMPVGPRGQKLRRQCARALACAKPQTCNSSDVSSCKRLGGQEPEHCWNAQLQCLALQSAQAVFVRQLPAQQSCMQLCAPQLIKLPKHWPQAALTCCVCAMHCPALWALPPVRIPHWYMRLPKSVRQFCPAQALPEEAANALTSRPPMSSEPAAGGWTMAASPASLAVNGPLKTSATPSSPSTPAPKIAAAAAA
mmetsp:Transcript_3277/g.6843  ORF Transcript_3277/g.6843 Transcript_3277/m.6843 type:complete len:213 (-) Transcript_3277:76-714(-)